MDLVGYGSPRDGPRAGPPLLWSLSSPDGEHVCSLLTRQDRSVSPRLLRRADSQDAREALRLHSLPPGLRHFWGHRHHAVPSRS